MQNLKPTKKTKLSSFLNRKNKVNASIKASNPDFRIVVNKSNKYIKAQLIDKTGNVVCCISDKEIKGKNKTDSASQAGILFAKEIKSKKIEKAVFDRNGYLYHGRIKAFVDGLRSGGMIL